MCMLEFICISVLFRSVETAEVVNKRRYVLGLYMLSECKQRIIIVYILIGLKKYDIVMYPKIKVLP